MSWGCNTKIQRESTEVKVLSTSRFDGCWNERALSARLGLGRTSLIVYATLLSMLHYICMLYVPCNAYAFASWAHWGQTRLPVLPQWVTVLKVNSCSEGTELVMFPAQLQAKGPAKPSQNRPGQRSRPRDGFGLAQGLEKPKPGHQAAALGEISNPNFGNTKIQESTKCAEFTPRGPQDRTSVHQVEILT
jgi:hypothetical protein